MCNKHYRQLLKYGRTFNTFGKGFNELIDKERYYEIIITDKDMNEVCRAKFDKEDLEKVASVGRWYSSSGYIVNKSKGVVTYMHRLVMSASVHEEIVHKRTGIKYRADNRKTKLRKCTHRQNIQNIGLRINNKSGFKGVSFFKSRSKWRARITFNGEELHLGLFDTVEEAYSVYKEAAKRLHKKFLHKSLT